MCTKQKRKTGKEEISDDVRAVYIGFGSNSEAKYYEIEDSSEEISCVQGRGT